MAVALPFATPAKLAAQSEEPVVSRDAISIHTVRRGNMPLHDRATGTIESLSPPAAVVAVPPGDGADPPCRVGAEASVQIGRVTQPGAIVKAVDAGCRLAFFDALPAGTTVGQRLESVMIEAGELENVVFFDRPANSLGHSEAFVFVVEPGNQYARRVRVRYGRLSGPRIQILSGLSTGDRVIVTDTSPWQDSPRVRLR